MLENWRKFQTNQYEERFFAEFLDRNISGSRFIIRKTQILIKLRRIFDIFGISAKFDRYFGVTMVIFHDAVMRSLRLKEKTGHFS